MDSASPARSCAAAACTRILEGGKFFERAGIGFSDVAGDALPPSASAARPQLAGRGFEAMGVSLVMHPHNPHCPTVHMNVRLLTATKAGEEPVFWFGGGMDLTPYYGYEEDARHFHRVCRDALQPFGADLYPSFKRWCDEYFFLKHRNEQRGIGGIFFDDFSEPGFDRSFAMMQKRRRCVPESVSADHRKPPQHAVRRSASASSRRTGAAATSSSIWCSTVARCSGCKAADAPNRS